MEFTREKLEELISTSDFDALLGKIENDWLECKSQPYSLDNDSGKRELAKDVSSFANYHGGYILLGIQTKKSDTYFGDKIRKISPFPRGSIDVDQYYNILNNWVYPKIDGMSIRFISHKAHESNGIGIIFIPEQKDSSKPFLIKRILDDKKQIEIVFGYAERKRDTSEPISIIDLQRALQTGFNYENVIDKRFNSLEAIVMNLVNENTSRFNQEQFIQLVNDRINEALNE